MSALLHLVGFGPARAEQTALLARACSPGDTLVLLDDGVEFAGPDALAKLRAAVPDCHILILGDAPVSGKLETLDHAGLVALTETHRGPASWY